MVRMGCLVEREEEEGDVGGWSWCCCWNGGGDGGEKGGVVGGDGGWRWRRWPANGQGTVAFGLLVLCWLLLEKKGEK